MHITLTNNRRKFRIDILSRFSEITVFVGDVFTAPVDESLHFTHLLLTFIFYYQNMHKYAPYILHGLKILVFHTHYGYM